MAAPDQLQLHAVVERSVEGLRTLNAATFPVVYQESFYKQVIAANAGYSFTAHYNGILVGAICCRLEILEPSAGESSYKLYIMTLGVLAPYRRLKIGTALLEKILSKAAEEPNIREVHLHVQTTNDEALAFYKGFGFEVVDEVKNYYRRIEPPDALLLRKTLAPACNGV
eukprot:TRINITY_DN20412_c0_g1_i1.p1 TRINITY_DN20412_c0_g1~~TRINITY_DN20412_c0_g1_i1.p1  ORF type:complete len:169 (+),score=33.47 TRINITY_DN20412_c0_g1_i1:50-556(+)